MAESIYCSLTFNLQRGDRLCGESVDNLGDRAIHLANSKLIPCLAVSTLDRLPLSRKREYATFFFLRNINY